MTIIGFGVLIALLLNAKAFGYNQARRERLDKETKMPPRILRLNR